MLFQSGPASVLLGSTKVDRDETFSMSRTRSGMRTAALLLASGLSTSALAASVAEPNCSAIESTSARLSCYDAAFPPKAKKPAETDSASSSGYKDPFVAEEARTAAKLKNICRGC
jgi:hypothetical protein